MQVLRNIFGKIGFQIVLFLNTLFFLDILHQNEFILLWFVNYSITYYLFFSFNIKTAELSYVFELKNIFLHF